MKPRSDREKAQRVVADDRKALHDFHVLDSWEAGATLLGTEAKAIREGRVNLRKQTHDKRETIRRREVDRETRAAVTQRNR